MMNLEKMATPSRLTLEVENKTLIEKADQFWETVKDTIEIKGFRKGNVPQLVAEKELGFHILYREIVTVIYQEEIEKQKLKIIYDGIPKYENFKVYGKFTRDGSIKIENIIYLLPEIKLVEFDKIKVDPPKGELTHEELDAYFEDLRNKNATFIFGITSKKGSRVKIDFTGYLNGQQFKGGNANNFQLDIGDGRFIPGFEDQIIGMLVGDQRTIKVKFPENYFQKELANRDADFVVKMLDIQDKLLPDLNDTLAKKLKFDSLEDLKTKTIDRLTSEKLDQSTKRFKANVLDQLTDLSQFDPIPEQCIELELEQKFQYYIESLGKTKEEITKQVPNIEQNFKSSNYAFVKRGIETSMVLEKLVEENNITNTDEEIVKFLEDKHKGIEESKRKEAIEHILSTRKMIVDSQLKVSKAIDLLIKTVS
jgi:trigger factor